MRLHVTDRNYETINRTSTSRPCAFLLDIEPFPNCTYENVFFILECSNCALLWYRHSRSLRRQRNGDRGTRRPMRLTRNSNCRSTLNRRRNGTDVRGAAGVEERFQGNSYSKYLDDKSEGYAWPRIHLRVIRYAFVSCWTPTNRMSGRFHAPGKIELRLEKSCQNRSRAV